MNKIISTKDRGFTIVELLVVIVVIGILAAITMVSYSGVTNKANTAANQSNANSVLSAAMAVYAETGVFPATNAASATVLTGLNSGVAKVPSGLTVTNATVLSTTATNISYRTVGSPVTGICVGYWDYTGTAQAKYIFGGTAIADNGTTCS